MRARLAGSLFAAAGAAAVIGLAAPPAGAATGITVSYPISGSTHIQKTNSDLALGPGTLAGTVDLSTGSVSGGSISLPPATGTFSELGLPVTVTTEFIQNGATTGQIDPATGAVTATSDMTLKITDLKVAGLDVPVGGHCQSRSPAVINVASEPGFSVLSGGTVTGTYTIPPFDDCLLQTAIINLAIAGPGNTITLTLGQPTAG